MNDFTFLFIFGVEGQEFELRAFFNFKLGVAILALGRQTTIPTPGQHEYDKDKNKESFHS